MYFFSLITRFLLTFFQTYIWNQIFTIQLHTVYSYISVIKKMTISCPQCHSVSTVWYERHYLSQQQVYKMKCDSCDQWFYKCKLCYNFQRSSSTEVGFLKSKGQKKRTASYFITFETGTKNNFCNQHIKTQYHQAIYNHVFSGNSCSKAMNTNDSSSPSTNNQDSTTHDPDDTFITCDLLDDQTNMSDNMDFIKLFPFWVVDIVVVDDDRGGEFYAIDPKILVKVTFHKLTWRNYVVIKVLTEPDVNVILGTPIFIVHVIIAWFSGGG